MHIVGIDLNHSRIENAKNLVSSNNKNITFEFKQGDFVGGKLDYDDKNFSYSLLTGVFEILDNEQFENGLNEVIRITIIINELLTKS